MDSWFNKTAHHFVKIIHMATWFIYISFVCIIWIDYVWFVYTGFVYTGFVYVLKLTLNKSEGIPSLLYMYEP